MSLGAPQNVTILGKTTFRNEGKLFGIRERDRMHSMYVIGRTGVGKSTLLRSICRQDAERNGFALLDPHGDLAEQVRADVPEHRQGDLIYFDAPNPKNPYGLNPLAGVPADKRTLAASGMLEVFRKLWPDFWGPRTEHLLRNTFLALVEQPEPLLSDALRLFDDAGFRKRAAGRVANAQVRRFWLTEYEGYGTRLRAEAVAPLQNKIGAFLSDPPLKRVLSGSLLNLDLRTIMDHGKVLVVNLAKGRIGEDSASLLGSLLVSQIGLAALARADVSERDRRPFFVTVDEFHSFATTSFAGLLSELRKFGVSFTLSHQYLGQLDERVRNALLANVGSTIVFRVGADDAEILERELLPEIRRRDLVDLPNRQVYVRLMVDGLVSRPFSGRTLAPRRRARQDNRHEMPFTPVQ